MEQLDFITGEKFKEIADMIFAPAVKQGVDYDHLKNTFDEKLLKEINIIYTHTMYVDLLCDVIKKQNCKFVLVSHNSDCSVESYGILQRDGNGRTAYIKQFDLPENVIKWYSTNINTINERIESIPIGLENKMWFKSVRKKEKMVSLLRQPKQYKNLVYMNHNINTNPEKRRETYQLFQHQPWVTVERGKNGRGFNEFINDVYNHKYVICPEGNGIDTIRFWETLYMSSVPIVKKNINNWFYNKLPVLYVDDWKDVTEEYLNDVWKMFEGNDWDKKELNFSYWKNKIHETLLS